MVDQLLIQDSNGPQSVQTIDWLARQGLSAAENHIGQVGAHTPRVTAALTRLDEVTAGAYLAGDMIGNSTTTANVVPFVFDVSRIGTNEIVSGRINGCRCVVAPASGSLVIANLDFDLLLFRSASGIPFANGFYPADNSPLVITAAMYRELVAVFSFVNSGWRNESGGLVAGVVGHQAVALASSRWVAPYNLSDIAAATTLNGLVQAKSPWNPGHINQRFDFFLDVDAD